MNSEKSEALYRRACRVIPGGISSNVRANWSPLPLFYTRGKGSRVWDADGNEYIDYVLGRGPLLLGHSPANVIQAVQIQLEQGLMFAGQTELEILVAEKMCELVPCVEMARFGSSGSESVHAALRLARAATGRKTVIRFEGHYHGWFGNIAWNFAPPLDQAGPRECTNLIPSSLGQLPEEGAHLLVLPWNDLPLLENVFAIRGKEIAAVITEPIMCNWGAIRPLPGFLEGMRRLCSEHGALLIFDEVITGFRVALGGAQQLFGVTPDLATFAKAMAGGMCVSALGGKADVMRLFGELKTVHAGTYNANPPAMAGALAALNLLSENDGAILKKAHATAMALMQELEEIAERTFLPLMIRGVPPVFHVSFLPKDAKPVVDYRSAQQTDFALTRQFWMELQNHGVRVTPEGLWFVSTAHREQDVDQTLAAVVEVIAILEKERRNKS
ncbi:MAG: aspartate aminotransferase family protein [Candidatus Omnitrophota bacterium]|jgi:glutamate-1-semialdehyde 2,1-aminomutase|nr:MAG: aspartate aminotransferase family protein [Candidatus Omnitrophota bacterium]